MSLIDEALKRARMEAAQRAAESEGLPYPAIPRHLAPPRRRSWLAPLVVALAVAGGLLVGLLLASRGGSGETRLAGAAAGDAAPPVAAGPATGAAPAGAGSGAPPRARRDPEPGAVQAAPPAAGAAPPSRGIAPESAREASLPVADQPVTSVTSLTSEPAGRREIARDPPMSGPTAPEAAGREPTTEGRQGSPAAPLVTTPPPAPGPPPEPPRPAPRQPPVTQPPPARVPASPPPPPVEPQTDPPPRPTPADAAPRATSAPAPPATSTTMVTDPDSGVMLVLPDRPEPSPPAAPNAQAPAESYVQRVQLADGAAIELGGIAWSETGPFALINGRVVGPGAEIAGFTLAGIQPGHVVLTGAGRRIHLSLQ